jgi:hypothetical protein
LGISPAFTHDKTNVVRANAPSPSGAGSATLVSTTGKIFAAGIDGTETVLVAIFETPLTTRDV